MKTILSLSIVLLLFIGCSEPNQQAVKELTVEVVKDTLGIVNQANDYKLLVDSTKSSLKSVQHDIYESAEGGTVVSFYNHSDTLKKEIIYYGETGKRIVHIYLRQGKTILIEDTNISYKEPISTGREAEISGSVTDVYYLDDEQSLIYWLKDGLRMPEYQYKAQEKEIIKE